MTFDLRLITAGLALGALLVALALLPGSAGAAQCKGGDASPAQLSGKRAAKAVLCLINKERRSHGTRALKRQHEQTKAAGQAQPAHGPQALLLPPVSGRERPDRPADQGPLPALQLLVGNRREHRLRQRPLGIARGIVDAWMHSAEHRANILNGSYQHIGVAVTSGTPAGGDDRDAATYTTDFGYKR